MADGMPKDIGRYRSERSQEVEFKLSEEARTGLASALKVWSAELKGLTKMMKRIRVAWQVRECHGALSETACFQASAGAGAAGAGEMSV
jgi:hypothetical protein